eukprot:4455206-Pleurochrysis_carterae.AAC.1
MAGPLKGQQELLPAVCTAEGLEVSAVEDKGRGLFATRKFKRNERLFAARAFGFCVFPGKSECCHCCLRFSNDGEQLVERCGGCSTVYCSMECRVADALPHRLACSSLARLDKVDSRKATVREKATAAFLLRAFAARGVQAVHGHGRRDERCAAVLPAPSFEEAAFWQCVDHAGLEHYDEREKFRQRVVRLALLLRQGKATRCSEEEAVRLLRAEPCNSYTLRDPVGHERGWAMYPHASPVNHSCLPNAACTAVGENLVFEALSDIHPGDELLQCYLRLGEESTRSDEWRSVADTMCWGFECACERCSDAVSEKRLAEFDRRHICACGCVVSEAQARLGAEECQCHAINRVGPCSHQRMSADTTVG